MMKIFFSNPQNYCNENNANSLIKFSKKDYSSKRALLVEDNTLNCEIAGEILGMAGLKSNMLLTEKKQ